ncbi:MAG: hypothetical protein ACYDBY_06315 [Thermoanaerobaculia bacterium]
MALEIVGKITAVTVIATGHGIRQLTQLRETYGEGHWRKLKGNATVLLADGTARRAEIHWYEAHGIGRRRFKIKRFLD